MSECHVLEQPNLESEKHTQYQESQEKEKPRIVQVSCWAIVLYEMSLS